MPSNHQQTRGTYGHCLFSPSFLWDDFNQESHYKVFIYNFIHHGGGMRVYGALTTQEPLCCGAPLVYQPLCKIKKELDPNWSPLRCNQTSSLQQRLDSASHRNISQTPSQSGLKHWVRVGLNPSGILPSSKLWRTYRGLISSAVSVTVIGETNNYHTEAFWTIASE